MADMRIEKFNPDTKMYEPTTIKPAKGETASCKTALRNAPPGDYRIVTVTWSGTVQSKAKAVPEVLITRAK